MTDSKRETSELFPFLEWLEPYLQPRNNTSNLILIHDERTAQVMRLMNIMILTGHQIQENLKTKIQQLDF